MQLSNRSEPLSTVVIVVKDEADKLFNLLQSLEESFRHSPPCKTPWPILIIDNNSKDEFLKTLKNVPHVFSLFEFQTHLRKKNSMSKARQDALELVKSDWITFLDSDIVVPIEWYQKNYGSLQIANCDKNIMAIGGASIYRGSSQTARTTIFLSHFFKYHRPTSNTHEVRHIPTSFVNLERNKILKIGGFSEGFDKTGEDIALSYLIRKNKGVLLFAKNLYVWHYQDEAFLQQAMRLYRYGRTHGRLCWTYSEHIFQIQFIPFLTLQLLMIELIFYFDLALAQLALLLLVCLLLMTLIPIIASLFLTFYAMGTYVGLIEGLVIFLQKKFMKISSR